MRKIRVQMVSVLLLLSLLLTGCSSEVKNYIHTDTGLKHEAEDVLEEKYGEKFVVHKVWTMSQTMFYATCSPEDNPEIVFQAQVYKDGRGVYVDEYIQAIIARKIEEKLQPEFEKIWGDCYIGATFYGRALTWEEFQEASNVENPTIDFFKNLTIEEYYEIDPEQLLSIRVFVDKDKMEYSEEIVKMEYENLQGLCEEESMGRFGAICYFVNRNTIDECKEYYTQNGRTDSSLYDRLEGELKFGVFFDEKVMKKSYNEYFEVRKEINTNE